MSALSVAPGVGLDPTRSGPRLDVDLASVAHNVTTIAARTDALVMAVVKADGFGHGAVEVARTALSHGATWLGVTGLGEALPLREAGLRAPVLSWLNPVDADFDAALLAGVDLAVPSRGHLDAAAAAAARSGRRARVHLHLDTGMARDGEEPQHWRALCRRARTAELSGRVRVVGVMGHLACADEPAHPANAAGRTRFAWGVAVARAQGLQPGLRHLAATSATLTDPRTHLDLVRVGAGLVGIDPSGTTPLRPAMTLSAPLVSVRAVRAGTSVGYDHTWAAPAGTTLGLVPLGYADGLPRVASGSAEVLVHGERRPVVGRISMDQLVVDLGRHPARGGGPRAGDRVTVFGPGDAGEPTAAEWAAWAQTLEHEIVTGVGARTPRVVSGCVDAGTALRGLA